MTPRRRSPFNLPALAKLAALLGSAWAFSVIAAEHVMQPHVAEARARVETMCAVTRAQVMAQREMCDALHVPCAALPDASMVFESCRAPFAHMP